LITRMIFGEDFTSNYHREILLVIDMYLFSSVMRQRCLKSSKVFSKKTISVFNIFFQIWAPITFGRGWGGKECINFC
jgi:hypothetical protein